MTEVLQDFNRLYEVVKLCYQCGTCASRCPIFRQYTSFNPRKIMKKLLLGEFNEKIFDKQQIWRCRKCYTCSTRCPLGIDVGHAIGELKNMALKITKAPVGKIES